MLIAIESLGGDARPAGCPEAVRRIRRLQNSVVATFSLVMVSWGSSTSSSELPFTAYGCPTSAAARVTDDRTRGLTRLSSIRAWCWHGGRPAPGAPIHLCVRRPRCGRRPVGCRSRVLARRGRPRSARRREEALPEGQDLRGSAFIAVGPPALRHGPTRRARRSPPVRRRASVRVRPRGPRSLAHAPRVPRLRLRDHPSGA